MTKSGSLPSEEERLSALYALNLLDTEPEVRFERITRIAARLFATPISLITLVDAERQWFKSRHGFGESQTPRNISFCSHAIDEQQLLVINDAREDSRFANNPMVIPETGIRFYAGMPLKAPGGSLIGTLCILDRKPRDFDEHDIALFKDMAQMAEDEIGRHALSNLTIHLHQANQERQSVIQASPIAIISYGIDLSVEVWNPAAERLFGLSPAEIVGKPLSKIGERLSRELEQIGRRAERGEKLHEVPINLTVPGCDDAHLSVTAAAMTDSLSCPSGVILLIADITERKQLSQELEREHELLSTILESVDVGVVACDRNLNITVINSSATDSFGVPDTVPPEQWAKEYQVYDGEGGRLLELQEMPLFRALQGESVKNAEIVVQPKGQPRRTLLVNGGSFESKDGDILGAVVALHDITQRKEMERELAHQAKHDSLTGLPNRAALVDILTQVGARATRTGDSVAALFIDLDNFKLINDTYGHQAGDLVLQEFALRLRQVVREVDTVSRLAGDEFMVVAEGLQKPQTDALQIAHKLLETMKNPIQLPEATINLKLSIGISIHSGELNPDELIRRADHAMYSAKRQGGGNAEIYQNVT